jgi:opacity protein-like surface antigen
MLILTIVFVVFSALAFPSATRAQNTEVFVGASFVRANPHFTRPDFRFNHDTDQIGFDVAITGYFGDRPIGLTADIAGSWRSKDRADSSLLTIMAGPTVKVRGHRVEPFVHGLVGVGRFAAAGQQTSFRFDKSTTGWAYALGGGLDIKINRRLAIRPLQLEYLSTRILEKNVRYMRAAAGIVISF